MFTLSVPTFAAGGSTDITATVKHPRTLTVLPHPGGQINIVAPTTLYAGDTVTFTAAPDPGYALERMVWYTTDPTKATDITVAKKLTMPDADVTVKVEFVELVAATVGGKVTEGGDPVPGAAVELYRGNTKAAQTMTDENGNYSFHNVEKGVYNIVVTKGNKVKTVLVTVDSTGSFSVNVALPVSAVNSVVEVSEGAASVDAKTEVSQIVVGGLDAIAEAETPAPGDKVTIKLTVEPLADTNTAGQQAIKRKAGNGKTVEFLDLSLWKQVNNDVPQPIGDNNTQLLTIVIPFDFTGVNVSSVMILRHHGSSEKLTMNPAPGQEGYVVDAQAGTITLYAMKFSDYAVAYAKTSQSDDPGWHHDDDTAVTSPTTGDAGLALYGVLSVSALMGLVWVGKKKKH